MVFAPKFFLMIVFSFSWYLCKFIIADSGTKINTRNWFGDTYATNSGILYGLDFGKFVDVADGAVMVGIDHLTGRQDFLDELFKVLSVL